MAGKLVSFTFVSQPRIMKALKACLLFLLVVTAFSAQAQRYDSLLNKISTEYRQEKLHLHFDRPVYNPGETIWFKAYIFAAGIPSEISKTLYAELLDAGGNVIERKIMPVVLSGAASSFDIPAGINGTKVFVRAYTKWMLNFDSTLIYTKAIHLTSINNKKIPVQVTGSTFASAISPLVFIQFFPEGGDLVQGIESRVAFKATDAAGMPVNIKGDIVDSKRKKITSFTAAHDGMGDFLLQPAGDERYIAIWKDPADINHETLLNFAKPTGVTLQLNRNPVQVAFSVKRPSGKPSPYPYVYLVAQMNGIMLYSAKVIINRSSVINNVIPTETFPAGVMQVTLFTPDARPVAERLIFINQADHSFITNVNAAPSDTGKRKKNVIEIDVPDTLLSNLSVAVTDADLTAMHTDDNIFSRVLLTSDIRGYVHNPAWYFSNNSDSLASHLDLVMMTNGWRRFKWEDILAGKWPALRYMPENYLSFEGQATGLKEKQLLNKELNIIIAHKNGNRQILNTSVQPDGKFILPEMVFYDTAKFFYQFNKDKNKALTSRAKFSIKNNLLTDALYFKAESSLLKNTGKVDTAIVRKNEEVYRQLTEQEIRKIKTLKPVVIKVRKKSIEQIKDEEYTSGFFSGGNSRILLPENDRAFLFSQDVFTFLSSRIPLSRMNQFSNYPLAMSQHIDVFGDSIPQSRQRNESMSWRGNGVKIYYLNEMQVSEQDLRMIPMNNVAMIKIFDSPFFGSGGSIAVYLKKGLSNPIGLGSFNVRGYDAAKEFYSPDYSNNTFPDADYRITLFWNPFIITDKNNRRISLTFYNNDITKKMKVTIEGCNENGQLTRVEKVL
jgi:hypothetical protein